jgi:hypothetical protein
LRTLTAERFTHCRSPRFCLLAGVETAGVIKAGSVGGLTERDLMGHSPPIWERGMFETDIKRQRRHDTLIYKISVTGLLTILAGSFFMILVG